MVEVKCGATFVNIKESRVIRLILSEIGHSQPHAQIHTDSAACVSIVNSMVKRNKLISTKMIFFSRFLIKLRKKTKFDYQSGAEILAADYPTKGLIGPIHAHTHPYYVHMHMLPTQLSHTA